MPWSISSARALLLVAVCLLCGANDRVWAQSAARVMAITGSAKAVEPQGGERVLQKGTELFAGDKVVTSDDSLVQVRLHDGGYMSVRPNTEMVIDRFVYDEQDSSKSSFLVSLLKGGFRSITGLIGRSNPSGYQIRSKTATIGIRGTDHEPVVILDTPGVPSQAAPGLYDKVNDGETFISKAGVVLPLRRGDVGFAAFAVGVPPQVVLKMPDFYKVELKTDARDAKDNSDDNKADGNKRAANGLLRPSVAARREALSATAPNADAKPAVGAQASGEGTTPAPSNALSPAPTNSNRTTTAPANGTGNNSGTSSPGPGTGNSAGATNGTGTAVTPLLTPEQKRAILQNVLAPKNAPTMPTTPIVPIVPIVPITPTR